MLTADCVPDSLSGPVLNASGTPAGDSSVTDWELFVDERFRAGVDNLYDEAVVLAEREVIARVLRRTSGNQVQAAKTLGITRTTLRTKMRQLGISLERIVHDNGASPTEGPAASSS